MLCPLPQTALTGLRVSSPGSGSALPGNSLNATVETRFSEKAAMLTAKEPGPVSSAYIL